MVAGMVNATHPPTHKELQQQHVFVLVLGGSLISEEGGAWGERLFSHLYLSRLPSFLPCLLFSSLGSLDKRGDGIEGQEVGRGEEPKVSKRDTR